MKTIVKVARKTLELTPLFALVILFIFSSFVIPDVAKYTFLRMQIHGVEYSAKANSYYDSTNQYVEDWGDGRREKYNKLNDKIEEFIGTSTIAKACNDYGILETKLVRNTILLVLGSMWILSIFWMVVTAKAEYKYLKRRYLKRKRQGEDQLQASDQEFVGFYRMMKDGSIN